MSVNINGCSRCGALSGLVTRFAACGAQTTWKTKVNRSDFMTQDGIKVWRLDLCKSCLASSYKDHLKGSLTASIILFVLSILMMAGSLYLLKEYGQYPALEYAQKGQISLLVGSASLIILLALFVGVSFLIGATIFLIVAVTRYFLNRNLEVGDSLPETKQNKAFSSEGFRIIRGIEKDNLNPNEDILNRFPLPDFKNFSDLPLSDHQKSKIDDKSYSKSRIIVGVAKSPDDLMKALRPGWRALLSNE